MSFDVDIERTVGGDGRGQFRLQLRFTTHTRRTVVYGPSGAGKSLTLQALAGLGRPDRGRIAFQGETLFDSASRIDVPARQRGFGYLFQDYALFPKLNVRQNVGFALRPGWRNPPACGGGAEDEAVDHWLRAFELTRLAALRPAELSGGQRQRVALARALVDAPRALLLDEPFSALDAALRQRMRQELDALLERVGIPVVMITHDPEDLEWFGEQAVHLLDGRVVEAPVEPVPRRRTSTT